MVVAWVGDAGFLNHVQLVAAELGEALVDGLLGGLSGKQLATARISPAKDDEDVSMATNPSSSGRQLFKSGGNPSTKDDDNDDEYYASTPDAETRAAANALVQLILENAQDFTVFRLGFREFKVERRMDSISNQQWHPCCLHVSLLPPVNRIFTPPLLLLVKNELD